MARNIPESMAEGAEDLLRELRQLGNMDWCQLPVMQLWLVLAGGGYLTLGILEFIPPFTRDGMLFHLVHTNLAWSIVHVLSGIAALAAGLYRKGRYAFPFLIVFAILYLFTFTIGNVVFGDRDIAPGTPEYIPWIALNGLHVTTMLVSFLVAGFAMLQRGARSTARYQRIKELRARLRQLEADQPDTTGTAGTAGTTETSDAPDAQRERYDGPPPRRTNAGAY